MTMDFTETTAGTSKEMPARVVIYGVPKIGKSRFAAGAPDPFYINIEGGLDYIGKEVRATPRLKSYDEVIEWLRHIYETDSFKAGTIVLDSLDWLETLAQQRLVKLRNASSITDTSVKEFAFFKGVSDAAADAIVVLKWLDAIYEKKAIKCILIAHSQLKTIDLPNQDAYSRHELKLSKALASKVNEWGDLILFADYSFVVADKGKTTSEPKPALFAGGSAAFVGGGRMQLTKELPLSYAALEQQITQQKD